MNHSRSNPAGSRFPLALVLLSVTSAMLAGCGSTDPGTNPETATKREFVERANAICNRVNEDLRAAMAEAFGADLKPDDETGIRFTHEIWVPSLREQNRQLRKLVPPPGDQPKIDAMLDALDRATDRVEADPALASEGPFDRVTRRLTAYGIGPCGSP